MPHISAILATADDLNAFAEKEKAAEELLPKILRRLVLASVGSIMEVDFPTGKSINEGGWDGHVDCAVGNPFVPTGKSGWELTARGDQKGKADDDYANRVDSVGLEERQETHFVHWNIRKWRERQKWTDERNAEKKWLGVKAYDAKDLETWLISQLGIHLWVSELIGKKPRAVQDIVSFWDDWSNTPQMPLVPEILIKGYEKQREALVQALSQEPQVISIQWEKTELAVAFLAAVLAKSAEPEIEKLAARCVFVKTEQAFDELVSEHRGLILVPQFSPSRLGIARKNGHWVVLALGRDSEAGDITLKGRRPSELYEAMSAWEPNDEKRRIQAQKATTKFISFYRSLIPQGTHEAPAWSSAENVPLLLLGRWDSSYQGDCEIVEAITGRAFKAENERAIALAKTQDALFQQSGSLLSLVDLEDGWTFLARHITDEHLTGFEHAIVQVFGEVDPQFEVTDPHDASRLMAMIDPQNSLHYSMALRQGLAESLCYLGSNGEEINGSGQRRGDTVGLLVVRKLLEDADTWQRLCSLSPWFRQLAEASPDEFLDALEREVKAHPERIRALFRDQESGSFFGSSSPHTTLLWALETLAWSHEFMTRATLVLARLAKLDPGGTLANRPLATLRNIFSTWHPGTLASVEHRLNAIAAISKFDDEICWQVLTELLPTDHAFAMPTAGAKYRPWGPLWQVPMTYAELFAAVDGVSALAVECAGAAVNRWSEIIGKAGELRDPGFSALIGGLSRLAWQDMTPRDRDTIREALRKTIALHQAHPGADWVMHPERLEALEQVYGSILPSGPVANWQWVFSDHALFELGPGDDFRAKQKKLDTLQDQAIAEILKSEGLPGLLTIADGSKTPWTVGIALARSGTPVDVEETVTLAFDHSRSGWIFALGLISKKAEESGPEVIWKLIRSPWGPSPRSRAAYTAPSLSSFLC